MSHTDKPHIGATAYRLGEKVKPRNVEASFDGKKIDSLVISATIESEAEILELINFLKITKLSFETSHQHLKI